MLIGLRVSDVYLDRNSSKLLEKRSCDWSDLDQFGWLCRIACFFAVDWELCSTHRIKITGNGYFTSMLWFFFIFPWLQLFEVMMSVRVFSF